MASTSPTEVYQSYGVKPCLVILERIPVQEEAIQNPKPVEPPCQPPEVAKTLKRRHSQGKCDIPEKLQAFAPPSQASTQLEELVCSHVGDGEKEKEAGEEVTATAQTSEICTEESGGASGNVSRNEHSLIPASQVETSLEEFYTESVDNSGKRKATGEASKMRKPRKVRRSSMWKHGVIKQRRPCRKLALPPPAPSVRIGHSGELLVDPANERSVATITSNEAIVDQDAMLVPIGEEQRAVISGEVSESTPGIELYRECQDLPPRAQPPKARRKRGRRRKRVFTAPKRRGRPPKNPAAQPAQPKKRGRPRKDASTAPPAKKPRGRVSSSKTPVAPKRRGRPAKNPVQAQVKGRRGRWPKPAPAPSAGKRTPGRPRKGRIVACIDPRQAVVQDSNADDSVTSGCSTRSSVSSIMWSYYEQCNEPSNSARQAGTRKPRKRRVARKKAVREAQPARKRGRPRKNPSEGPSRSEGTSSWTPANFQADSLLYDPDEEGADGESDWETCSNVSVATIDTNLHDMLLPGLELDSPGPSWRGPQERVLPASQDRETWQSDSGLQEESSTDFSDQDAPSEAGKRKPRKRRVARKKAVKEAQPARKRGRPRKNPSEGPSRSKGTSSWTPANFQADSLLYDPDEEGADAESDWETCSNVSVTTMNADLDDILLPGVELDCPAVSIEDWGTRSNASSEGNAEVNTVLFPTDRESDHSDVEGRYIVTEPDEEVTPCEELQHASAPDQRGYWPVFPGNSALTEGDEHQLPAQSFLTPALVVVYSGAGGVASETGSFPVLYAVAQPVPVEEDAADEVPNAAEMNLSCSPDQTEHPNTLKDDDDTESYRSIIVLSDSSTENSERGTPISPEDEAGSQAPVFEISDGQSNEDEGISAERIVADPGSRVASCRELEPEAGNGEEGITACPSRPADAELWFPELSDEDDDVATQELEPEAGSGEEGSTACAGAQSLSQSCLTDSKGNEDYRPTGKEPVSEPGPSEVDAAQPMAEQRRRGRPGKKPLRTPEIIDALTRDSESDCNAAYHAEKEPCSEETAEKEFDETSQVSNAAAMDFNCSPDQTEPSNTLEGVGDGGYDRDVVVTPDDDDTESYRSVIVLSDSSTENSEPGTPIPPEDEAGSQAPDF